MDACPPIDIATQDIPPFKQIIREMRQNWHTSEEVPRLLEGTELGRKILRRLEEPREILRRLEERIEHEGEDFLRRILILQQAHSGVVLNRGIVEAFILCDVLVSKVIADLTDQSAAERQLWIERRRLSIEFEIPKMAKDVLSDATKTAPEKLQALERITEMATKLSRLPSSREVLPGMRSDRNGSRALRIFVKRLSPLIREATGRWCDAEVATLAQIVFNRRGIDVDNIRKLRAAPTTRSARQSGASGAAPQEMPDLQG
jgi:hypothetical protein